MQFEPTGVEGAAIDCSLEPVAVGATEIDPAETLFTVVPVPGGPHVTEAAACGGVLVGDG